MSDLSLILVAICVTIARLPVTHGAYSLTILHTNDVHSRIDQMDQYGGACSAEEDRNGACFGGSARIRFKIEEIRASQQKNVLVVDAGDQFQGSLWYYNLGGAILADVMNWVGYEAMALGNHEFDNGVEGLIPFIQKATFPVLSCNLNTSDVPQLTNYVRPSKIFQKNGQFIGVIGYTTPDTSYNSRPGDAMFLPLIAAIQAAVKELEGQNINKIIALGHAGYEMDQTIAQQVSGIDVIVGAHSGTFLYTGTAPSSEKVQGPYPTVVQSPRKENVLIVSDYAYGKYLGNLDVQFNDNGVVTAWGGNPILLDNTVPQDNVILQRLAPYRNQNFQLQKRVFGRSLVLLEGVSGTCRVKECNLGNMVADAMVRQNLRSSDGIEWSDVGIAMINGGGLRSSLSKGAITEEDVLNVLPFRHNVDIVQLSGQTILDTLEFCASKWKATGDLFGGFLQVSGMRITYDMHKKVNNRVAEALVVCTDCQVPEYRTINTSAVYKVLMPDFLIEGGDGYNVIKDNALFVHKNGIQDATILLEYIPSFGPLITGLEGRIRFLDAKKKPENNNKSGSKTNQPCGSPGIVTWSGLTLAVLCAVHYIIFARVL